MHSAGAISYSEIWNKLSKATKLDSNHRDSSSSSSSSSSFSSVHSHSAGDDAAPRRDSAKRVLEEAPLSDAERQLEATRAKYRRGALDFCPGVMPPVTTTDGTRIQAHSFGLRSDSAMARITNTSTNADVYNAITHDVIHGKRDVGLPPAAFQHSLFGTLPEMFMQISEGLADGDVPTNESAGVVGWGATQSDAPVSSTRQSPAICGFTGRRRTVLQQSFDKFGEC